MEILRRENSGIAVNGEGSVGTSTSDLITVEYAPQDEQSVEIPFVTILEDGRRSIGAIGSVSCR